jgi:hypothetical protein
MKTLLIQPACSSTPELNPTILRCINSFCLMNTVFGAKIKNWPQNGLGLTKLLASKVKQMSKFSSNITTEKLSFIQIGSNPFVASKNLALCSDFIDIPPPPQPYPDDVPPHQRGTKTPAAPTQEVTGSNSSPATRQLTIPPQCTHTHMCLSSSSSSSSCISKGPPQMHPLQCTCALAFALSFLLPPPLQNPFSTCPWSHFTHYQFCERGRDWR